MQQGMNQPSTVQRAIMDRHHQARRSSSNCWNYKFIGCWILTAAAEGQELVYATAGLQLRYQPLYQPRCQPLYQPRCQPLYQPRCQPLYQPRHQPPLLAISRWNTRQESCIYMGPISHHCSGLSLTFGVTQIRQHL